MADTSYLRCQVEEYVRKKLSEEFGVPFHARLVKLFTGGTHEFDAVSEDSRIVAAIKATGGKETSGRISPGKIKSALAEVYFLTLVSAEKRLLVLTSPEFYATLNRRVEGRLAPGIELKLVRLPKEMEEEAARIRVAARREVSPSG